ncbi:MAG: DUF177 domain-containing protein [Bacteroidales bacterium]|jgi:uncharacterized metal-binding protein YceD (DUF177 family)|nr:DUF177 domain-containing protein [Bacteroidales bacterium]
MFCIQFSGLSLGHHPFEFDVDDAFFKAFDYSEISNCKVHITIDLEKTERFLKLDFHFSGEYAVPCDRCLESLQIPINHDEMLIVNFGQVNDFDTEVWTVAPKEHDLHLNTFIYETLVLLRPFSAMHNIHDCNPDMLKKLQNIPPPQQTEVDPRWDALKGLKR